MLFCAYMLFLILALILLIFVSIAAILSLFCCIFAFILSICIFALITVSLYFLLISLMLLYYMYADFICYSLFRYSYLYLLFCCCSFSISISLIFVFVLLLTLLFDGINFDVLVLLFYDDTLVLLFCDLLLLFLYIFDILSNNLLLLSYTINFLFTNTSYMIATTFCIYNTCCTQLSYVIASTPNTLIIAGALTVYIKFLIVFKSSTF